MDRYRVVVLPGFLRSAASAPEAARRELVEILRELSLSPRGIGIENTSQPGVFSAHRGSVIVDYEADEQPERLVSVTNVVVLE